MAIFGFLWTGEVEKGSRTDRSDANEWYATAVTTNVNEPHPDSSTNCHCLVAAHNVLQLQTELGRIEQEKQRMIAVATDAQAQIDADKIVAVRLTQELEAERTAVQSSAELVRQAKEAEAAAVRRA